MNDPAFDAEDFLQDAKLAICEGRLGISGLPTAVANSKRSSYRHAKTRREHTEPLASYLLATRHHPPDPAEDVATAEEFERCAHALFCADRKLLIVVLLRAWGCSRNAIAQITGLTPSTVSRARKRAAAICRRYAPE